MNILVTGANGQLGMEMRNVSAGSADRYIFTDVAELDITDVDAVDRVIASEKVEVIVNCAHTPMSTRRRRMNRLPTLSTTGPWRYWHRPQRNTVRH